jgi:hypothetical protein
MPQWVAKMCLSSKARGDRFLGHQHAARWRTPLPTVALIVGASGAATGPPNSVASRTSGSTFCR